jgi:hypothetical protein
MTKTFTLTTFKNLSKKSTLNSKDLPEHELYHQIKPKLDELYRDPSEETIEKILNYANKK